MEQFVAKDASSISLIRQRYNFRYSAPSTTRNHRLRAIDCNQQINDTFALVCIQCCIPIFESGICSFALTLFHHCKLSLTQRGVVVYSNKNVEERVEKFLPRWTKDP